MNQQDQALQGWLKFLNPDSLRSNLIAASLYLTTWEMLQQCVIEQLEGFYCLGLDPTDERSSGSYFERVLSRDKSPFRASLLWFLESGAIDQNDIDMIDKIRVHRNEIAHELPRFMASMDRNVDVSLFHKMVDVICKIDRWWICEVELPTNSEFDGKEIDYSGVSSGRMIMIHMMLEIATTENSEQARKYYEHFVNNKA